MPTIKGPLKFKNFNANEFLKGQGVKMKLPFKATGWKSSKKPDVEMEGIEEKQEPVKKKAPKKK